MFAYASILALLYFVAAQPVADSTANSRSLWGLAYALGTEQTFIIDSSATGLHGSPLLKPGDFPNSAYFEGHYYSGSAPGAAIVVQPFLQIGRLFGNPEAWGIALTALLGAATVLLIYAGALKLGSSQQSARFAGVALGLGSLLWRAAGQFTPSIFSIALLSAALLLVLPPLPRTLAQPVNSGHERLDKFGSLLLGALLGLAVTVDYQNVLWLPLFVVYMFFAKRTKLSGWLGLAVGWVAGLLPLLLYNTAIFGKPWAFSYGFLLDDKQATSFSGQFLNGYNISQFWQAFFGSGRASLGIFILFFGVWGLVALSGQRGKRSATVLLASLGIGIVLTGLMRRPVGGGEVMADFIAPLVVPLAYGSAIWFERIMFLTRLEYRGLPTFSTLGIALYYLISPPGPSLPNIPNLIPILPLILLVVLVNWLFLNKKKPAFLQFRFDFNFKAILSSVLILVALFPLFVFPAGKTAFAEDQANNLLYNPELKIEASKVVGWYGLISNQVKGAAQFQPYLVPVLGGKVYGLEFQAKGAGTLRVSWIWSDEGHEVLNSFAHNFVINDTPTYQDFRAAPPAATYLQLVFDQTSGEIAYNRIAVFENGVRVEPMKNYATAALSFSFDWESAMGGLVHSRGGGTSSLGESGGDALTDENKKAVLDYAEERGMEMRQGADNLLSIFQKYGVSGTFYATGYNLLDGNTDKRTFSNNPIYRWAKPPYWENDFWARNPWYGADPYGTYQSDPAWYFGDQTTRLQQGGQEIASHTFGHLLVRAATPADLAVDLKEWLTAAHDKNLPAPRSFAFPWKGSNSLTPVFYDVLYEAGFRFITRTYNLDQGYEQDPKDGSIAYLNSQRDASGKPLRTATPPPDNYYFYLDRVHYALTNTKTGKTERSTDSRFLVLHDYQLLSSTASEQVSNSLIDELLRRRGGYGSIWTHPEVVSSEQDKAAWERVVAYAAQMRDKGLWVDGVEAIMQFRADAQQIGVKSEVSGKHMKITLNNPTAHSIEGLTLTLPAPLKNAPGAVSVGGAQLVAPKIPANSSITLEVELA
jgi:peptidoglycan/xylan/chitin deacetylase (PgdA/CDA1 family)